MQAADRPLSRYRLVDTAEPEEAREQIGRIFCPHFLEPAVARPEGFHARHHHAPGKGYSVNFVSYGAAVEIDPGALSRFFLLQIPLAGSAEVRCGTALTEAAAGVRASLLSPTLATRMRWSEGCEKLILLIERRQMEAQFEALTHRSLPALEFDTAIPLDGQPGQLLLSHAGMLLSAAEGGRAPDAYLTLLRDGLTTLLLTSFRHSGSDCLASEDAVGTPGCVRRAEEFIRYHASEPIAMADIARAAGIPLRTLQAAFRRYRGMTLSDAVISGRLDHFRTALLAAPAGATIADLAYGSGFGHLGRASGLYRERYGESPSATLRRLR